MKICVLGKVSKQSVNENTGAIRVYTNLYYYQDASDYERQNGFDGFKTGQLNTALDCSKVSVNNWYEVSYEPTGYSQRTADGRTVPQFAIASITPVEK